MSQENLSQEHEYEEEQFGEEIEIEAIGVEVSVQPIELYKVFKIANLVSGGGEAKHVIAEGYVAVNGELEILIGCPIPPDDDRTAQILVNFI